MSIAQVALSSGLVVSYASIGGRSGPALVMLPGPTDSWRSYAAVLDELTSSMRSIAVSQRGHGDTDKPPAGYRVEDFAHDVPLLLDALDIDRAVIAGHSGSCLVARRVAIDHPQRVAGLVLEASPTTLVANAKLQAFLATVPDSIDADFARGFVLGTSAGDLPRVVVDGLVDELLKVPAQVWMETFQSLLGYDDLADIHRIAAPTLLVWGDADPLVSQDMQEALAARIPAAELVVYRGFGHTPRWEDPVRFADDLGRLRSSAAALDPLTIGSRPPPPRH
jgi:pimeloyl-ACP methyl ester carboxylesterase